MSEQNLNPLLRLAGWYIRNSGYSYPQLYLHLYGSYWLISVVFNVLEYSLKGQSGFSYADYLLTGMFWLMLTISTICLRMYKKQYKEYLDGTQQK